MIWLLPIPSSFQAFSPMCIICYSGTYLFAVFHPLVFPHPCAFPHLPSIWISVGLWKYNSSISPWYLCLPHFFLVSMVHWGIPLSQYFVHLILIRSLLVLYTVGSQDRSCASHCSILWQCYIKTNDLVFSLVA